MQPGLLIFDGDCAFCTSAVQRLERSMQRFPKAVPWQRTDFTAYGLSLEDVTESAWIVDTRSPQRLWGHGDLASAMLRGQRSFALRWLGHVVALPGLRQASNLVYRQIAEHRHQLPGGTPACALPTA